MKRKIKKLAGPKKGRIETGPVQFGDNDWPGVFIRGDDACCYHARLRSIADRLMELPPHWQDNGALDELIDLFKSSAVTDPAEAARIEVAKDA